MVVKCNGSWLHEGLYFLKKNRFRWLIAIMFHVFMANVFVDGAQLIEGTSGFGKIWFESFCGSLEFSASYSEKFELPIIWIIFQAYLLYLICDYLNDNRRGIGIQRLIRKNSRKKWFLRITVTNIVAIVGYYVQYIVILGATMCFHKIPFSFMSESKGEPVNYVVSCFFLPICATITIFLIQNAISLYYEFIAYIVSLTILVLSAYWKNYFLLGNYAMFLRNGFYRSEGLDSYIGMVICICAGAIAMLFSLWKISRSDIIGRGLEEK